MFCTWFIDLQFMTISAFCDKQGLIAVIANQLDYEIVVLPTASSYIHNMSVS